MMLMTVTITTMEVTVMRATDVDVDNKDSKIYNYVLSCAEFLKIIICHGRAHLRFM